MSPASRALRIYLANAALGAMFFWMVFTAGDIYRYTVAGLSALQLVLVGTTLELAVFLFESPTGVVADIYGRRRSVIIGTLLLGCGFIIEGSLPSFAPILLAQVVWGIGFTFTSGALQAWITDEVGEQAAGNAFLREAQFDKYGALAGIAAGSLLGSLRLNLPILLGGVLFIIWGLVLLRVMPETGFHPAPRAGRKPFAHMVDTFRTGFSTIRFRPGLRGLVLVSFIFGLYSEGYDRLWRAHMLDSFSYPWFEPVVWLGLLTGTAMLLAAVVNAWAARRLDTSSVPALGKALFWVVLGMVLSLLVFAVSNSLPLAFVANLAFRVLRTTSFPIHTAWVNRGLESSTRATVLSMSSQVDALGQIASGPAVGYVAQRTALRFGLYAAFALLAPVLAVLARLRRGMGKDSQDPNPA
jgi:DHA3 family tetracycline resistance protein-like MFS transporter